MARLPLASRESVPEDQRAAFDEIVKGAGSVPRFGPGSVMINVPHAHQRVMAVNKYLRTESSLPKKLQELAMLVTAREMDCQYIWNAQAPAGRRAGLSDALVDALRDKKPLPAMPADEAAVVRYGLELTATNQVSQETFQAALDQLGAQGLTEFTTSMGYFRMLALNANAFTIDLPQQRTEPLLPV